MTVPLRVLLVSYAFPPVGGAGVQRVLKLAKFLPGHGVTPAVLTVANPSVPVRDATLEDDVPGGLEILRARTLEPGYAAKKMGWEAAAAAVDGGAVGRLKRRLIGVARQLLVPDAQALWLPNAGAALARRLLSRRADDVVLISGPPFSQFLLAWLCRLRPGTAVVLDYRDEWTTTASVYEMGGAARVSALLERVTLRSCHAVTTATEAFRSELLERFDFLEPDRVHTIENGYDPDDFPVPRPSPPRDRFVLTYVGTVFRLTSARGLLAGVRLLCEREPDLARLLEVRFIGRIVETEAASFEGMESMGVQRCGYLGHREALAALAGSHAVLCLLADVPGAERIYPAKIFEIMFLGRPCLAITPEGALAELVRSHRLGEVVAPADDQAVFEWLADRLRRFRDGEVDAPAAGAADIARFHRRRQAGAFAQVLRAAAEAAHQRGRASLVERRSTDRAMA